MKNKQNEDNKKILELQKDLVPLIQEMYKNGEICFSSMFSMASEDGNFWKPAENMPGKFLYTFFEERPDWVVEMNKKISDDYQKVIEKFLGEKFEKDLLAEGKDWIFEKLELWIRPIIDAGLIKAEEIEKIKDDFREIISRKSEEFFGQFHGNVIGDHIFIGEDTTPYLLGMRIVPRPGRGYYDFLRSLDWMLLKADKENNFDRTAGWMQKYLGDYDWEEIKLVFALRCVGIMGWDALHRGDHGVGDFEQKKEMLLKFIRREY